MKKILNRISSGDLPQEIEKFGKENCVIIDARGDNKFALGHIPGAVSVDPTIMNSHLRLLNYLRKSAIFIYCGFGIRTQSIVEKLKDAKFKGEIYSITDGFEGWIELGFEIE